MFIVIPKVTLNEVMNMDMFVLPYKKHIKQPTIVDIDVIAKKFNNVDTWKRSSAFRCWNCSLKFNTYPKFVPINYLRVSEHIHEAEPFGNFCSWNCVISYIKSEYPDNEHGSLIEVSCIIASLFEQKKITTILPSPPRWILNEYSGSNGISENEYKNRINELSKLWTVVSTDKCDSLH
jgi:MYM-type Zinc finger with FCS sequence motif